MNHDPLANIDFGSDGEDTALDFASMKSQFEKKFKGIKTLSIPREDRLRDLKIKGIPSRGQSQTFCKCYDNSSSLSSQGRA